LPLSRVKHPVFRHQKRGQLPFLGSKRSSAAVLNTFRVFRIILTNAVKYVTNVDAYDRRIQSAINIQGKKMQRRAEFLLTRALRQAGWK
jgi:hypothetical protein